LELFRAGVQPVDWDRGAVGGLCGDSMAALPGLPKVEELIHDQDCDQ
jgi:hypothetical protein